MCIQMIVLYAILITRIRRRNYFRIHWDDQYDGALTSNDGYHSNKKIHLLLLPTTIEVGWISVLF